MASQTTLVVGKYALINQVPCPESFKAANPATRFALTNLLSRVMVGNTQGHKNANTEGGVTETGKSPMEAWYTEVTSLATDIEIYKSSLESFKVAVQPHLCLAYNQLNGSVCVGLCRDTYVPGFQVTDPAVDTVKLSSALMKFSGEKVISPVDQLVGDFITPSTPMPELQSLVYDQEYLHLQDYQSNALVQLIRSEYTSTNSVKDILSTPYIITLASSGATVEDRSIIEREKLISAQMVKVTGEITAMLDRSKSTDVQEGLFHYHLMFVRLFPTFLQARYSLLAMIEAKINVTSSSTVTIAEV